MTFDSGGQARQAFTILYYLQGPHTYTPYRRALGMGQGMGEVRYDSDHGEI